MAASDGRQVHRSTPNLAGRGEEEEEEEKDPVAMRIQDVVEKRRGGSGGQKGHDRGQESMENQWSAKIPGRCHPLQYIE